MAFENVYGYESIKRKLLKLKGWYDKRNEYVSRGVELPRGLLLYGEAGCGKSLIAGEFARFIDPSPIIIASKKDLAKQFELAKKESKEKGIVKAVMIDELDLIVDDDSDAVRILQSEIDGFSKECQVFPIATANNIDSIPDSLQRSGRFDYRLNIGYPGKGNRAIILKCFFEKYGIPLRGIDFDYLSSITAETSCADLKLLTNTIRLELDPDYSVKRIEDIVAQSFCIENSITEKEERNINVAVREAGHACIALLHDDRTHFFRSLLCAGDGDGSLTVCNYDDSSESYEDDYIQIQMDLAGRLAEEIVASHCGVGSCMDYKKARLTADKLISRFGYGRSGAADILPMRQYEGNPTQAKQRGEELQYEALLVKAEAETKAIIMSHATEIKKMADVLMDKGVLTKPEAFGIMGLNKPKNHNQSAQ
jgi:cell division protease FtsH